MDIKIIQERLEMDVYGFSGVALNGDFSGMAFRLMDRMWKVVKTENIGNKGKNIWIYDTGNTIFAGVELTNTPPPETILEYRRLVLPKYAWYKHVGPYSLIKQMGQSMNREIGLLGYEVMLPYIEIYGHWTSDESQLETALIMSLR